MAARRAAKPERPIDVLPQLLDEVVVTSGKVFRAARRGGKGNPSEVAAALEVRIPAAFEKFNSALDDIECDILRAKAVLLRDLNQLRANRKPPTPPPEQKPLAPPTPTVVKLESPTMTTREAFTGLPGPRAPATQANKPVAPFPNMGFESASPEVPPAPNPRTLPKPKDAKNTIRPAAATVAAAGRPASAPPKENKIPPAQVPKLGGAATAPQTPLNTPVQPTPNIPAAIQSSNAPGHPVRGSIFTDMTFSLAPTASEQPPRKSSLQQPQAPEATMANIGVGDPSGLNAGQSMGGSGGADMAGTNLGAQVGRAGENPNAGSADVKLGGPFDLGSGGMDDLGLDLDLNGDHGDNSNFNDMYFGAGDGSTAAGQFDDAYFNLSQ
ncbi:hypothetical protein BT67DRAFT_2842 [Trichocladium antarcticum]|uniref:Uncharacterized protein n=1 Tax=Trichocladium antarcticum TaxID=1450529 RepID=A0AAN6ZH37_9PEZI|nr:hypothetical protein BT67DRAFT_2842 [Trichocladium antarcticum]